MSKHCWAGEKQMSVHGRAQNFTLPQQNICRCRGWNWHVCIHSIADPSININTHLQARHLTVTSVITSHAAFSNSPQLRSAFMRVISDGRVQIKTDIKTAGHGYLTRKSSSGKADINAASIAWRKSKPCVAHLETFF